MAQRLIKSHLLHEKQDFYLNVNNCIAIKLVFDYELFKSQKETYVQLLFFFSFFYYENKSFL